MEAGVKRLGRPIMWETHKVPFLTSQYHMAVSFDIRMLLRGFLVGLSVVPAHGFVIPGFCETSYPDLLKPLPLVASTGFCGYR